MVQPRCVAQKHDPAEARRKLASLGFKYSGSQLYDRHGNAVTFSLITNAGNKARARLAALIQEDLKEVGIQVNITTLDFPSLLERIGKTFDYDACLLGLVNVDPDPNAQMNVCVSSAANHQWNPNQKVPATPWEAEIDKLMREQVFRRVCGIPETGLRRRASKSLRRKYRSCTW